MPILFEPVRSGDIIRSELMNELIAKLAELDQRVNDLEGQVGDTGQVVITQFDPPTQVEALRELNIYGVNFAFPPELNTVTVDNLVVSTFLSLSNSSRLQFIVPEISDIPSGGRNVIIRVSNSNGSSERLYRVLPAVPVVGDPPFITLVTRTDGNTNLRIGETAIITGGNFSTDPAGNIIEFIVEQSGGDVIYPPAGQSLNIISTSATEIQLTVPEIAEVPTFGAINVQLGLTVGAHNRVLHPVSVRRP